MALLPLLMAPAIKASACCWYLWGAADYYCLSLALNVPGTLLIMYIWGSNQRIPWSAYRPEYVGGQCYWDCRRVLIARQQGSPLLGAINSCAPSFCAAAAWRDDHRHPFAFLRRLASPRLFYREYCKSLFRAVDPP